VEKPIPQTHTFSVEKSTAFYTLTNLPGFKQGYVGSQFSAFSPLWFLVDLTCSPQEI